MDTIYHVDPMVSASDLTAYYVVLSTLVGVFLGSCTMCYYLIDMFTVLIVAINSKKVLLEDF